MKLLTKEILKRLPPLYSQEKNPDPMVVVKFFTPWGSWTWYGYEYDPAQRLFFGYVVGQEKESGYFSLTELEQVRGPFGVGIERDMSFRRKPLSEIKAKHEAVSPMRTVIPPDPTAPEAVVSPLKFNLVDYRYITIMLATYTQKSDEHISIYMSHSTPGLNAEGIAKIIKVRSQINDILPSYTSDLKNITEEMYSKVEKILKDAGV